MSYKQLLFKSAAREKVLKGATALADAVRVTLGPKSKCVLIEKKWGRPLVCDDGVTIAKEVCGINSQKAANLARDDRVSLTIDHDTPQVMEITGLSMAAHTQVVVDPTEAEKALRLLMLKYPPQQAPLPLPMPTPADVRIFRVAPMVISLLDYSKGFGHTDLVTC